MDANTAEVLRKYLLNHLEHEHPVTLTVIEACPDDKLQYKPHEKAMEFGAMAVHIYGATKWFISLIKKGQGGGGEPPPPPTTKAGIIAACKAMQEEFVKELKALSTDELVAKHDVMGFMQEHGIILMTWHANHMIHHRAQLQTYLRTMGAKCPSIYGGSADTAM